MSKPATADARDTLDPETAAEVDHDLEELLGMFELIDWRDVPEFGPAEASALSARLQESREIARDAWMDQEVAP